MSARTVKQVTPIPRVRGWGKPHPIEQDKKLALTYEDVASLVDLPIGTLRKRVQAGRGPRLTLVGRHHRFLPADVTAWLEDLRDQSGG
jgi:excisionase family DNA binding protein